MQVAMGTRPAERASLTAGSSHTITAMPNHALQRTSHGVYGFHSNPRLLRHGSSLSLFR